MIFSQRIVVKFDVFSGDISWAVTVIAGDMAAVSVCVCVSN